MFYRPVVEPESNFLTPQPMYKIRKPLAERLGVKTSELSESILSALTDIERGVGNYCWAFEEKIDAEQLLKFTASPRFKQYTPPKSMEEAGTDLLAQLFPLSCTEVEELNGEAICPHPFIGPRAGAGSIQSEVPHLIDRKDWLKAYGFGKGHLMLIRVCHNSAT